MLGANNFAETVMPNLMAKNTETVTTFLEDLAKKTIVKANKDHLDLQDLKRQYTGKKDDVLMPWDLSFFARI